MQPNSATRTADVGLPATTDVATAGRVLGVSRGSAYKAVHRGDLPVVRLGHRFLVSTAWLRDRLGLTDVELAAQLRRHADSGQVAA